MTEKRKIDPVLLTKAVTAVITIASFVVFAVLFSSVGSGGLSGDGAVRAISAAGWVLLVFCLLSWRNITGGFVTVYSVFLLFIFLFTYGQCLFWAFDIHVRGEIGSTYLYTFDVPDRASVLRTMLVTLMGILSFHCGAVLMYRDDSPKAEYTQTEILRGAYGSAYLYEVCKLANIISTPMMFYSIIRAIIVNRSYGYGATLYNADVIAGQNNIVMLLRLMYIPSIIGLLIGSRYKRSTMIYCYISFALFTVAGMLAGDRGEWLFPLLFLVWMHNSYKSRINLKKLILYGAGALALTVVSVAIRNSRSGGITLSGLWDAVAGEANPIVSAVFEMGDSMRPALTVIRYGWGVYPYGNSYLLALAGMVTERVITAFEPGYVSLSSWFSASYLKISYGAGFSFIAEAVINYGPYLAMLALLIIGMILSRMCFSVEKTDHKMHPLKAFFCLSSAYCMVNMIRNTLLVALKQWVFSTLLICLIYLVFKLICEHRGDVPESVRKRKNV